MDLFKIQNPDWGIDVEKRAYVEDLENIIRGLQSAINQLVNFYTDVNGVMNEGYFSDGMFLRIKWEFGVEPNNEFRPGFAPHTDAELLAIINQPEGFLSGNLMALHSIVGKDHDDAQFPTYWDVENPLYPHSGLLYYYTINALSRYVSGASKRDVSVQRMLLDYLLSLVQSNPPPP